MNTAAALFPASPVISPGRALLWALLLLFLVSCVFDPADRILSLKVPIFGALAMLTLAGIATGSVSASLPKGLIGYVLLFVLVPAASVAVFFLADGRTPYEGFNLLKGYVLVAFAIVLYVNRIDLLAVLSWVLLVLALLVIGLVIALMLSPGLYELLYFPGAASGLLFLDRRDYGSGVVLLQAYFVTTPMLVVPIAYFFEKFSRSVRGWRRSLSAAAFVICVSGMFLAGTRNNMAVALLLPLLLIFLRSRSRVLGAVLAAMGAVIVALVFQEQISALLSPSEYSNSLKLSLLQDYGAILDAPRPLLAGYGLGAYEYWDTKAQYYFISELTYLEMIRNFGVPGALTMLGLLLFPLLKMWGEIRDRHLAIAFSLYLVMCASNPNLYSSMGILILSILVANCFLKSSPGAPHVRGGGQ